MRFLFVMDPATSMLPDKDTSFAFIRAAAERGHTCFHCLPRDVENRGDRVSAIAREIRVSDRAPHVELSAPLAVSAASVSAIFLRKDPPFDDAYLWLTQQLDLASRDTLVVNDPTAVRDANEKLFTMNWSHLMPPTLVSAERSHLIEFVSEVGGQAIIKPLDGAGGSGVIRLTAGDQNVRSVVDLLTHEGKRLAMVQQFLPSVSEGDKRVLLLDGKLLGTILRIPRPDEFRANIHVGGTVAAATLTDKEQAIVEEVGDVLSKRKLWFVGLDLIAERLIEVNVTSPTGIQELARLTGTRPEVRVVEWVEQKATEGAARQAAP